MILTSEGPRLVEIAGRFSGGCMQYHQQISTGDSQIDRAVRHYLDGAYEPFYRMVSSARTVWLSAHSGGRIADTQALETGSRPADVRSGRSAAAGNGSCQHCGRRLATRLGNPGVRRSGGDRGGLRQDPGARGATGVHPSVTPNRRQVIGATTPGDASAHDDGTQNRHLP